MKHVMIAALMVLLGTQALSADTYESPVKAGALAELVVQDQGRLKPLDTYARSQLLLYHNKFSIERQKAIDWLLELWLFPETAYERKVFKVLDEKEAITALGVGVDPDHLYSFRTLSEGINERMESLRQLSEKAPESRTRAETQLLTVYRKVMQYLALSRAWTALEADITIENAELADAIGLEAGKPYTYREFMESREALAAELQSLQGRQAGESITERESAMVDLVQILQIKMADQSADILEVLKPENDQTDGEWSSVWGIMDGRAFTNWDVERIKELEAILAAFKADPQADVSALVEKANASLSANVKYGSEVFYNRAGLFGWSTAFYTLSFLVLLLSYMLNSKVTRLVSFVALIIGLLFSTFGIIMRVYIMARPPIGTLYESIIFVSAFLVLVAALIEFIRRDTLGLILGSIAGIFLNYIGSRYALDGDTKQMLVAVLNSRFWLLTHVQTIVIGYAIALLAGLISHAYLVVRVFKPGEKSLHSSIFRVSYGVALVAVFFTTFGTILGGIWGDQSWGRFWGWDPKENGALLIVLWLLAVVHGRLAGRLKELSFSVMLALTPITVAVAWFGVNLLQVGLHSYGFDDGTAINLLIFCIFELVFAVGLGLWIQFRKPPTAKRSPSEGLNTSPQTS